uniref:YY1-associated factor 2 n=1 Tax=Hydra vulgaris TaxID=6087 RepID=T2MAD0_HYDVU
MDERSWSCSVCTYSNASEAFKCKICDTRKGTSTRKPRVTANIVAQQIASSFPLIPDFSSPKYQKANSTSRRNKTSSSASPYLKYVDHRSRVDVNVTVGEVTVVISDYKLLPKTEESKINGADGSPNKVSNDVGDAANSPLANNAAVTK